MYPKLKFKIDYKKDISTFYAFNNDAKYSGDEQILGWAFLNLFPELKKYKKGKELKIPKAKLESFIKNIYKKDRDKIEKGILITEKEWSKKENEFYLLTKKIFKNHKWPKGKYIVYATIWGMYPRFLEDKTFQIPYEYKNKDYINVVIAHEMLHFIFYDYFYKKFPTLNKPEYNFELWKISEVFNVIIQNSPEWLKNFKEKTLDYPEHKELIKKLKKIWNKEKDIDKWIKQSLKYLNI